MSQIDLTDWPGCKVADFKMGANWRLIGFGKKAGRLAHVRGIVDGHLVLRRWRGRHYGWEYSVFSSMEYRTGLGFPARQVRAAGGEWRNVRKARSENV